VEKIEGQIEKHWDGRDRKEVDRRTDRETEGRTRHTEDTDTEIHG
jgi:hypothetical protein